MMNERKKETNCRKQSIARKILEIPFSLAIEMRLSKFEILSTINELSILFQVIY